MRVKTLALLTSAALATAACGGTSPGGASPTAVPDVPTAGEQPSAAPAPAPSPSSQPPVPSSVPEPSSPEHEWVVSPTGNDTAAGTEAAPLRTISRAIALARPGHRIRVLAGTYAERILLDDSAPAGTADAPITLEGEGKPTLVPSNEPGAQVTLERPHWHIRGFNIDLKGRALFGVAFAGNTEGSLLADSEVHHAAYGAGVSIHRGARGATLENNHIHHIWLGEGKDAHGVSIQPTVRDITLRNNVIHDNSGDAIQCYSPDGAEPAEPATHIVIEDNDLYGNYEQSLDIKTCRDLVIRRNRMHDNQPRGNGAMVVHMSASNVLIEENDFFHAGTAIGVGGNRYGPMPSGVVIQRNLIRDMRTDGGRLGSGVALENSEGTQVLDNTFTRLPGPALVMGGGTGGPTSNLVVKNNLVDVPQALKVGSHAPGLQMDNNLYQPGAVFQIGEALNLEQWKAQGQDANSQEADAQLDSSPLAPTNTSAVDQGAPLGNERDCGTAPDIGTVKTGC
ncbi:right-handed parallel beta-helix repeat-containing protein [Archangium lansingense]|uniref:Right-handed parallel beta-helix repeat-containing protein n=1 Tax=Archangium lansingense TaxID=2995310 RepID=A0ABT4ALZ1_9BACT|nr:right-handed parallel beta-helix repeat-containing protein [Archangium lansinium]MCY1081864.1 right-handed parallel beta-helix repeat-containing protein [Archangium lansinium]